MILVDTHVVVWLALDQTHLSKNARAAIDDARRNGDGLAISDALKPREAELGKSGSNLNQIAHVLNTDRPPERIMNLSGSHPSGPSGIAPAP